MRAELGAVVRVDDDGEEVVDFGGGLTLPAEGWAEFAGGPDFPNVRVFFRWAEGRFEAQEVHVKGHNGEPVTGEVLRKIPVERMLRGRLARQALPDRPDRKLSWPEFFGEAVEDDLREVAAVYRLAFAAHQPPVKAVAEHFGIPASTAGKKVMAARKAGFLPPTTRGKASA